MSEYQNIFIQNTKSNYKDIYLIRLGYNNIERLGQGLFDTATL